MTHTTPSERIFDEIKEAATKVWQTKDNTFGYVDEKLAVVNRVQNNQDDVMICYRMFDANNQQIMRSLLSEDAIDYVNNNL